MYDRNSFTLIISLMLIAAFLFTALGIYASSAGNESKGIPTSARSAVLYEPETQNFLFLKNADNKMPMASTTKIMTALVALENCETSDLVRVDDSAIGIEGSSAYIRQGEVLTVEELLYALLLQSANDAAVALAFYVGGDDESFASMMNARAEEIGASNTHFTNPHGLDDDEHYTTARDLALITAEALKNDTFRKITSTYKKSFFSEGRSRTYVNHNKLLKRYDGCIGVKTGFTQHSGRCLVSAAERDGLTFISVTLDAPDDWNDHATLFNMGYDTLEKITLAKSGEFVYKIPLIEGRKDSILVSNTDSAAIILDKGEHNVEKYVKLVRLAVAPIKEGEILGEIIYTVDGQEAARVNLTSAESVLKKEKSGFFQRFFSIFDK